MKNTLIFILSLGFLSSCSAQKKTETASDTLHYLALGDSYTIGESVPRKDNFPHQLVRLAKDKNIRFDEPEIIAKTGWRTDQLLKAIDATKLKYTSYDLVTLLIGVNDEYQGRTIEQYQEQFKLAIQKAIQLAGNDPKKVWVFSIPDYGYTPFGSMNKNSVSARIDAYNKLNEKIAKEYKVNYLNITEISRKGLKETNLIADDGLHPSTEMYELWIGKFLKEFKPQ